MHDSTVYANSTLSDRVERGLPVRDRVINGIVIPLHILGNPAYALPANIIKGYTGRNLTPEQESFNVYHSAARMMVENAFGRLKARWRMVLQTYGLLHRTFTICCCCLLLPAQHLRTAEVASGASANR